MRAISTVVDTTVFLLLLGGAVATLVVGTGSIASPPAATDPADETAELLTTTTHAVEYDLRPTANDSDGVSYSHTNGQFGRSAHGTTAGLLAAATRSTATLRGERLTPASGGFERAVRAETRAVIQRRGTAVAVTAHWTPYDGAPIEGRLHVGPEPPARADVRAARVTVDSGFEPVRERALDAARANGTDGVARVAARSVVEGFFPPEETRVALRGDTPVDTLTAHRYRRVARLSHANLLDLENASAESMNEELTDAVATRLHRDMQYQFSSPETAARALRTGETRIVVRTWSP